MRDIEFIVTTNKPQFSLDKIYVRRPLDIYVTVEDTLKVLVQAEHRKIVGDPNNGIPVFIAQRFHEEGSAEMTILREVYDTLIKNGCVPVVALPEPDPTH
jgi:hypothetical protein